MFLDKLLGKINKFPSKKKFLLFFIIILIPNLLRQLIYFVSFLKTGSTGFIISTETVGIFGSGKFLFGVLEEILIGVFYTYFWFRFRRLKFLSYAWITDALFDYISVLFWFLFGGTVLQLVGLSDVWRLLFRELILFYLITGPLLYKFKVNIKKMSLVISVIGVLILLLILLL